MLTFTLVYISHRYYLYYLNIRDELNLCPFKKFQVKFHEYDGAIGQCRKYSLEVCGEYKASHVNLYAFTVHICGSQLIYYKVIIIVIKKNTYN